MKRNRLGDRLRRAGFDLTCYDRGYYRVQCSQCVALVINCVATHERGCCNAPRAQGWITGERRDGDEND